MFDTVRVGVRDPAIDPVRLLRVGWEEAVTRWIDVAAQPHERVRFVKGIPGGSPHFVAYYPASGTLITEASLPKVLYSENISMLAPDDVGRALDKWGDELSDFVGATLPRLSDWQVTGRADAVFSWQVGDNMVAYLHALAQMHLARHRVERVADDSTVYWRNRSRWLRAYDKYRETGLAQAKGILRFEAEMRRPKSELLRLGRTGSVKAGDVLNWDVAQSILGHYLAELGTDLVVSDEERVFSMLLKECGRNKAARLLGFLALTRLRSREDLVRLGFRRNWIWRNSREIAKAGVSAGMVESGLLPPLLLPAVYDGSPGRV